MSPIPRRFPTADGNPLPSNDSKDEYDAARKRLIEREHRGRGVHGRPVRLLAVATTSCGLSGCLRRL